MLVLEHGLYMEKGRVKKVLTKALFSIAVIVLLGLLTCNTIQISTVSNLQKELLKQIEKPVSSTVIINKDDEILEAINGFTLDNDVDTKVAIKECEVMAMQTVINIFSTEARFPQNDAEYKFDYLSNKAYQYFLEQRGIFKGQHLSSANINGSGYNAQKERIEVFMWFAPDKFDARTQYNFFFTKSNSRWIINEFEIDS